MSLLLPTRDAMWPVLTVRASLVWHRAAWAAVGELTPQLSAVQMSSAMNQELQAALAAAAATNVALAQAVTDDFRQAHPHLDDGAKV